MLVSYRNRRCFCVGNAGNYTSCLSKLLGLAVVICAAAAANAAYPERPINFIVPFPAGAGTDLTARTIAACMETKIDHSRFVVLNRPGAAGDIGLNAIAQAAPDGYTIGIVNTPGIVSLPIERERSWTLEGFDFIANLVEDPGTLNVHADSPIHTIQDFVDEIKNNPNITIGTQGIGSAGHISALMIERATGAKVTTVPFQGAAPAAVGLLSRVIDSSMANLGEAMTFAKASPWRIVGVMSAERSAQAPEIPTFRESGYDVISGSMRGVAAPRGLPAEILATLSSAVAQCNVDQTYLSRTKNSFQPLLYLKRDEYVRRLKDLDRQLREIWQTTPWTM